MKTLRGILAVVALWLYFGLFFISPIIPLVIACIVGVVLLSILIYATATGEL